MNDTRTFQDKSYQQHSDHFKAFTQDSGKGAHARTWLDDGTVDAWRHQRMYQILDPILAAEPGAKWLTVGDGRFGKDAKYILDRGGDALATDISEHLLKEAVAAGYLTKFKVENAESLSFADSSFDYVFCKESYHHFPRPARALYEMLRVARRGVVLVEPNDAYLTDRSLAMFFRVVINLVKQLLGKTSNKHAFEDSGNYLYSVSRRELEKLALGLNYRTIVFKGINDAYLAGVEYEKMADKGPLQKKLRRAIGFTDLLCSVGLLDYRLLAAVIYKEMPSKEVLQELKADGCEVVELPDNPHIID